MSFRKFSLKHITLMSVLPAMIAGIAVALIAYPDPMSSGYGGMTAVAVMFLLSVALRKYHSSHMKRAQASLYDKCDPYPTLEEVKLYIECAGRRVSKLGLTVTLGMMQALAGEYENAEKTFGAFDVGEGSTLPEAAKAGILYDLSALYCAMSMPEHAIDCYDRAKEHFEKTPDSVRSKMLFDGTTDAEIECYKGNIPRAHQILDAMNEDNLFHKVMKTFTRAKVHYIEGKRSDALTEFDWVARNGGRLACARDAAEISAAARAE